MGHFSVGSLVRIAEILMGQNTAKAHSKTDHAVDEGEKGERPCVYKD